MGCVTTSLAQEALACLYNPPFMHNIFNKKYMFHYAIIHHFDQMVQKTENFYLANIFKVKHYMSSYKHHTPEIWCVFLSQNS